MAKVINRKGKLSGSSKRSLNRAGKKAQKALNKGIKKATKSIKKGVKNLKNSFKVGNATVRRVSVSEVVKDKPKGSSKQRLKSRRSIAQPEFSTDELRKIVSSYAKTANKRLRNLEGQGLQDASAAYRHIRSFAYDHREFMGTTKNNEFKFRTDVNKMDKDTLRREAMELDTFLFRSKTSTVRGVRSMYSKIFKSLKDSVLLSASTLKTGSEKTQRVADYFSKMSLTEFAEFWQNQNVKLAMDMYGSDFVVGLIDTGEENNLDLEKMNEILSEYINDQHKDEPLMKLQDMIEHDIKVRAARSMQATEGEIVIESTEPTDTVDEEGLTDLY